MVVKEGSYSYSMWQKTPIPMYNKIYYFNCTNAIEVMNNGDLPLLKQVNYEPIALGGICRVSFREDINEKKNVFFRALPESPKPPPLLTPIRATWSFFSDVKIQDFKVT